MVMRRSKYMERGCVAMAALAEYELVVIGWVDFADIVAVLWLSGWKVERF